ncbi:type B 50S ribosomal protein L31 [Kineococcus sp. SYSU DK003]|uniref:type B 50S ribosomal protein L31 n=1 Tax=Kineococcus sp. SYSU DK003 TaxID=3383124 RepID=UPI003D7CE170
MKSNTHPAYGLVAFRDKSAGTTFLSRSTLSARDGLPRLTMQDGDDYPVFDVDVSSASHPFWTGNARVLDSEGRVEKFRRRYGRR